MVQPEKGVDCWVQNGFALKRENRKICGPKDVVSLAGTLTRITRSDVWNSNGHESDRIRGSVSIHRVIEWYIPTDRI
jgi:hypothetical protein